MLTRLSIECKMDQTNYSTSQANTCARIQEEQQKPAAHTSVQLHSCCMQVDPFRTKHMSWTSSILTDMRLTGASKCWSPIAQIFPAAVMSKTRHSPIPAHLSALLPCRCTGTCAQVSVGYNGVEVCGMGGEVGGGSRKSAGQGEREGQSNKNSTHI